MPRVDIQTWDEYVHPKDDVHILQTSGWGQLKSEFGWEVEHFIQDQVGAQILFRKFPLGYQVAYIPKGPIGKLDQFPDIVEEVINYCRGRNVIFLKIEPDWWEGDNSLEKQLKKFELNEAKSVQPRRTMEVDLQASEEELLARMKQKTRYNIRLAGRKGVVVDRSTDMDTFYQLMDVTADRDEFGVHSKKYYQRVLDIFGQDGKVNMLIAEFEGQPLAAIMVLMNGHRAWYFYGASSNQHRNLMPTYLLQWEGIRWAKSNGALTYDLWGIPDHDLDKLEDEFTQRNDGLWGVYRFKRGFGGEIKRAAAAQDIVFQSMVYQAYKQIDRFLG